MEQFLVMFHSENLDSIQRAGDAFYDDLENSENMQKELDRRQSYRQQVTKLITFLQGLVSESQSLEASQNL